MMLEQQVARESTRKSAVTPLKKQAWRPAGACVTPHRASCATSGGGSLRVQQEAFRRVSSVKKSDAQPVTLCRSNENSPSFSKRALKTPAVDFEALAHGKPPESAWRMSTQTVKPRRLLTSPWAYRKPELAETLLTPLKHVDLNKSTESSPPMMPALLLEDRLEDPVAKTLLNRPPTPPDFGAPNLLFTGDCFAAKQVPTLLRPLPQRPNDSVASRNPERRVHM